MRTLTFTFVSDSRFDSNTLETINSLREKFLSLLPKNVEVTYYEPYNVDFPENSQHRQEFFIRKSRGITWNEVMKLINSIKAMPYNFI